ncbi:MAG: SUMF1/EgtB/PvdO family nonheme iron enzyme [Motiliproteus sp.]|nr:SUMF1/EgtB/PvdO family nonheme iron enzyme [Motiliproteus sp.]MCW9053287.1 SUMF1/EgtB/PvdO family nonheme iron enzyme [Motiliproteus sp.]
MAEAFPLDFSTLRKGMILGPEHHQFKLLKPVSNSPIGQVWHAEDLSTGDKNNDPDKVAIEIVNPVLLQGRSLELFKTQVSLCKQLDMPHIAKTYGYFLSREGWMFVAMEPINTRSLARILLEDGYQQLSVEKSRIILSQVAKALDFAHKKKISHGDLSPWNVIITPKAGVKLVNFAFRQPLLQQIQKQGMRILNTEFHAPEAFDHLPLSNSADIFSFACLVYQLFSGHPPFSPEQPLDARDVSNLEAPKQLSLEQWETLKPALSDNPGDRPASATALLQKLFPTNAATESADAGHKLQSTPIDSAKTIKRTVSVAKTGSMSSKTLLSATVTFIAGVLIGYGASTYLANKSHDATINSISQLQSLLAQPVNSENKVAISQLYAELKASHVSPQLLSSLDKQLEGYKVRLTNAKELRARPKTVMVGESTVGAVSPSEQKPELETQGFIAGSIFKDEIIKDVYGPNMVVIPAGKFTMGDRNRRGDDNELPAHQVHIRHPFALSQNEVTFSEYDLFALDTGRTLPDDEGWGRGDRPVINVSWNDANAYADWLRRKTGLAYRLPTEAEWEYGARAKTATAFWWGNDKGRNKAVCDDCGSPFDGRQTAPVGSFKANAFGLNDMNGNVYEWVSDCYNNTYHDAPKDGSSWNVGQCNYRVMRGGSWYDISRLLRSASRYRHPPNSSRNSWGFRLALDLE